MITVDDGQNSHLLQRLMDTNRAFLKELVKQGYTPSRTELHYDAKTAVFLQPPYDDILHGPPPKPLPVFDASLIDARINIKSPLISVILRYISNTFRISQTDLLSAHRSPSITLPRQIAFYLSRVLTTYSYPQIGDYLNRDHTSIMSGVNRVAFRCWHERALRSDVDLFINTLRPKLSPHRLAVLDEKEIKKTRHELEVMARRKFECLPDKENRHHHGNPETIS